MEDGTNIDFSSLTKTDAELLDFQLNQIFTSVHFKSAQKLKRFLSYIIEKTRQGEAKNLKQYTIAVEALGFPDDFDSEINPAVRIIGGRVRERLSKYYQNEGKDDALIISIPKGAYTPHLEKNLPVDNTDKSPVEIESQGPKLGIFCYEDEKQSSESNHLLVQVSSTLAKELSHYIFLRLYVQIPYLGKERADVIGKKAIKNYNLDYTLLMFIHELPDKRNELVYRLWDNSSEEVISSEILNIYKGQPETEKNSVLDKISAIVADLYQGKLHSEWGRKLLKNKDSIPKENQALAYYRYYADHFEEEAFKTAVSYCQQALERSPHDVIANVLFADYCRRDYVYNFDSIDNALERGKKCAEIALRYRRDSHEAHFVMAQILFCLNDWEHSINEFNLARDISKNHAIIEYGTGFHFCLMGHWDEGMALTEKVMALSDTYPPWYHITPFLNFYRQRKYPEALQEAIKISTPKLPYAPLALCAAYGQLSDTENAKKALQDVLLENPDYIKTGEQVLMRFLSNEELTAHLWEGICKGLEL